MSDTATYHLGVDPGWVNLGAAILKHENGEWGLVESRTFNPSKAVRFNTVFSDWVDDCIPMKRPATACIERYVSYKGVNTAEAENILMLIGGLRERVDSSLIGPLHAYTLLVRAIDWKTDLVKYLVKNRGFDNPSMSLDKKFSIAAAKCIIGNHDIKTDHEADAICLAAYPSLLRKEA
jgi:hypothetical protein